LVNILKFVERRKPTFFTYNTYSDTHFAAHPPDSAAQGDHTTQPPLPLLAVSLDTAAYLIRSHFEHTKFSNRIEGMCFKPLLNAVLN
jgi:hypothetical protein